ncbi:MAG TPA: DUF1761 domain-containing protein [Ignavibacteria bacterium]|nr:DUF1761 domain-containing protein [Ignavibacteria bacterium]
MDTIFSQLYLPAVFVSAVAYFLIGALWYSPLLFAKQWIAALDLKPEDIQSSPVVYISTFIGILIIVFILAVLVILINTNTLLGGMFVGAIAGVGFVLTTTAINNLYAGRSLTLTLVTSGYHIAGFIVSGIILAKWK